MSSDKMEEIKHVIKNPNVFPGTGERVTNSRMLSNPLDIRFLWTQGKMCACNLTLSQRNRLKVLYLLSIIVVQNKKDFVIKKKGMCVFNITRIKQIIKKLEKCNTKWHYSYALYSFKTNLPNMTALLLLLLSRFSRVRLCATPETAAHQAPPSLGFSRQEHWSGLPFPSPMHEREK